MQRRRRLRLRYCSSDEEDEDQSQQQQQQQQQQSIHHQQQQQQEESETLIGATNSVPNPIPSESATENVPLEITDDDFMDVSEDFSPPPPPPPPRSSGGSDVEEFLRGLGLGLRREWLDSCVSGLAGNVDGFERLGTAEKARLCFEQFLLSDMNYSGGGVLPLNVHEMHLVDLEGPFVLQVDEIVNISCPLRDRYQKSVAGIKRCLKLSMTDGVQRVFGMEYRPIKDLEVLAPSGLKVAIRKVNVRRGLLMLVPEVIEVLGGLVEDLDAARLRLVCELEVIAAIVDALSFFRGAKGYYLFLIQTRTGTVPSLASRATHAAWPVDNVDIHEHANSTVHGTTPFVSSNNVGMSGNGATEQVSEEFSVSRSRSNNESHPPSNAGVDYDENNMVHTTAATSGVEDSEITMEELVNSRRSMPDSRPDPSANTASLYGEADYDDRVVDPIVLSSDNVEDPILLTGDDEIPFMYLTTLLEKWAMNKDDAPFIQGKIKCILTGVKGFQFKNRTKFELHVYVDDGSLISEVQIHHNLVEKGIGCSPQGVTAALSSPNKDTVSKMKETMKRFQAFLADFEGTMLVEMNGNSSLPIALEMNHGCLASDAWLLLRRVKNLTSPQTPRSHHRMQPIDISP
ncbi:hypothetical protein Syun_020212 [Stephania yunnanensis]|uniref:RecQ-mediated genome instability protein 1 n=1 Tax=Stephania yunnanensis TaxID=152371 RepID=A0AAP0IE27_9MAGN